MFQANLLLVDDCPDFLNLLNAYLEPDGYNIITATTSMEVFSLTRGKNHPTIDAILLDRKLGDMDGLDLFRQLKKDERFCDVPVIMITGLIDPEQITEGIESGVYYYLTKPISRLVLRALVRTALATVREQRSLRNENQASIAFHRMIDHCEVSFRTLAEIQLLAPKLAQLFPDPPRVVTGITEILINAVEHGNLGLTYEDKSLLLATNRWETEIHRRLQLPEFLYKLGRAVFIRGSDWITLTITDCGLGFDWQPYLDISTERAFDTHGRGIALSRLLSFDRVEYKGCGNEVVLSIRLGE